jgi:hypothetical protein
MTPRAAVALLGLYLPVREVFASWNGAAGIRCEGNDTEIGIERLFEEVVVPAWGVAARLDPLLGGYGSARLVLSVAGDDQQADRARPRYGRRRRRGRREPEARGPSVDGLLGVGAGAGRTRDGG